MTSTPKQNYRFYIEALTRFQYMIESWMWKGTALKKKHRNALGQLIAEELAGKTITDAPSAVPSYVLRLWHYFLIKIKKIEINLKHFEMHVVDAKKKQYGFKVFSSLFINPDTSALDFSAFLKLLPNL